MVAQVFMFCVSIVILGWLWFFIVRPILVDYGVIRVVETLDSPPDVAPVVMSRSEPVAPQFPPSSQRTDDGRTETTPQQPKFTEDQLLTFYTELRAHGMKRDRASVALKAMGIPMNNNLWAKAQVPTPPPAEDDDMHVTPFAGRRTRASFYPDSPDLEYNDPPR